MIEASSQKYAGKLSEIRESAKYYVTAAGILQATYFTITTIAGLKSRISLAQALILYAPIVFWMVTLLAALRIMEPGAPFNPYLDLNQQLSALQKQKARWWKVARLSFYVGLAWMFAALLWYLFFLQVPSTPTIMIIVTPTP